MRFFILSSLLIAPLAVLATPSPVVDPRAPSRVVEARAVVTPPPCKAISPPPTEAETKARHDAFASAFLVRKNLTEAFTYISSTYIVRPLFPLLLYGLLTPVLECCRIIIPTLRVTDLDLLLMPLARSGAL